MSKEMQRLIRHYRDETGIEAIDMKEVAKFAASLGWKLPEPTSPIDLLAKKLAKAARQETKTDKDTGRPYRVNHALPSNKGSQGSLWVDIDQATRSQMQTSLTLRREQTVGDVVQLTFDAEHWSAANKEQPPIEIDPDFSLDVELRKAGEDLDDVG